MKKYKVNGRTVEAKSISDAVKVYKSGYSNFVKEGDSIKDALPYAESVDELTAILNRILKEKNPVNIHETINIYGKGKNSPAKIGVIAYRGKLLISAEPFGGKAYEKDLPYDFNTKTVKKEDVNKIVGPLFRDSGEKVKDFSSVDFEKLLASERQAVEDYREAISQTTDAKLLTVLSHILKEETEHIEELEAARKGIYEDKGLMDAEVLTKQERIRFVEKLTAGLQKPPYNYDKMTANEIAIKRADALDPQWRARWGGDVEAQVRQELRNTAPKDSVRDAKYKPATLRSYVRTPKNGGGARVTIESMEEAKRKGWEDLNEDVDFLGDIYHLFFDENGDMGDKFKLVLKKNNTPDGYLRFIPAPKQVRNNLLKVFTSIPDGWEEGRDRRIIPYAPIGFSIIQKIGDPSEIALLKRW